MFCFGLLICIEYDLEEKHHSLGFVSALRLNWIIDELAIRANTAVAITADYNWS